MSHISNNTQAVGVQWDVENPSNLPSPTPDRVPESFDLSKSTADASANGTFEILSHACETDLVFRVLLQRRLSDFPARYYTPRATPTQSD